MATTRVLAECKYEVETTNRKKRRLRSEIEYERSAHTAATADERGLASGAARRCTSTFLYRLALVGICTEVIERERSEDADANSFTSDPYFSPFE